MTYEHTGYRARRLAVLHLEIGETSTFDVAGPDDYAKLRKIAYLAARVGKFRVKCRRLGSTVEITRMDEMPLASEQRTASRFGVEITRRLVDDVAEYNSSSDGFIYEAYSDNGKMVASAGSVRDLHAALDAAEVAA